MKSSILTFLLLALVSTVLGQIPNWGMQSKEAYTAIRKSPCYQYRITRTNTNPSIESWIEYFDCQGVLQKAVILPPDIEGEVSETYVCSWSYVEGNQAPLPEGGIPLVLTVEQLDGCYESYYRNTGGGAIPPPVVWPDGPPPSQPWTPAMPTPLPPEDCSGKFWTDAGWATTTAGWVGTTPNMPQDNKRYIIQVPPGKSIAVRFESKGLVGGGSDWFGAGLPSWMEWERADEGSDFGRSIILGSTIFQEDFDRIMTEEKVDTSIPDGVSGQMIVYQSFDGGDEGATYYLTIKSPVPPAVASEGLYYQVGTNVSFWCSN